MVYEQIEGEETPKSVLRFRKKYMSNLQKSQLEFEEVRLNCLLILKEFLTYLSVCAKLAVSCTKRDIHVLLLSIRTKIISFTVHLLFIIHSIHSVLSCSFICLFVCFVMMTVTMAMMTMTMIEEFIQHFFQDLNSALQYIKVR